MSVIFIVRLLVELFAPEITRHAEMRQPYFVKLASADIQIQVRGANDNGRLAVQNPKSNIVP
jgi:hypothetical protein